MDPNLDKSPALALPSPSGEYSGQATGFGAGASHASPEAMPMGPESATPAMQSPAAAIPAPTNIPLPPAAPMAPSTMPSATAAASPAADNASVNALDQEWINKAKAIVEHTKNDPYVESKELSKAKADYLRIRYNKQVKVVEDA